jgi:choline dehydrogenase-like flavoprotein
MNKSYEYTVIGSGPAAAMAAQTLAEAGKQVLVLDAGIQPGDIADATPADDFLTLRSTDASQYRYFLGEEFEAAGSDEVKPGAQLTPARQYMTALSDEITPVLSDTFRPVESLAYGGLGVGWGLGCYVYSDNELEKAGLPPDEMASAYQTIANRIGITASNGSLKPFVNGKLQNLLPSLPPDNNVEKLLRRASALKPEKTGMHLGLPSMAILTQDFKGRKASSLSDMDFYTDHGHSNWRPWMTFDDLRSSNRLDYRPNQLVTRFIQEEGSVLVSVIDLKTREQHEFRTRFLLLAAGALGNARILLRSDDGISDRLPLLCNPYAYMPCLNIRMPGRRLSRNKTSMAQAMMIYQPADSPDEQVSVALYTYRSLMLQRLAPMVSMAYGDTLKLLNFLHSAFVIAGIHHPDSPTDKKYISLVQNSNTPTGDMLAAHYELNADEEQNLFEREKHIKKALRSMGCIPVKRMDPGYGGSIHYGGTIPFSDLHKPGTQNSDGSINGFPNVFVTDASGFSFLPAKGVTLSIMANAHRITLNALNRSPK